MYPFRTRGVLSGLKRTTLAGLFHLGQGTSSKAQCARARPVMRGTHREPPSARLDHRQTWSCGRRRARSSIASCSAGDASRLARRRSHLERPVRAGRRPGGRRRRPPLRQDAPVDGRGRSLVLDRDPRRARAAGRRLLRARSRRRRNCGRRSRPAEHLAAFLAEPEKIESVYPDWDFWGDTADRNRAFLPGEAR